MDKEHQYFDDESDVYHRVSLPVDFIHELSSCISVQEVLDSVAKWLHQIFDAERASVTLVDEEGSLKVYAISGDSAIPRGLSLPITGTFVGKVFSSRQLMICDDVTQSTELDCELLKENGLNTCMDAPLLSSNKCLGTLNVAHRSPFRYTTHHAIKLQCIANWIASNVHLHQQIEMLNYQASIDHLTQCYNRRRFIKDLKTAINYFLLGREISFLGFADLDHFKNINDQYGHLAGDHYLKQTVSMINALLQGKGTIYRLGGEEFGILLCEADANIALDFFESVRLAVEELVVKFDAFEIQASLSIGVTFLQPGDFSQEQVLKRADNAVYKAKSLGRNQVVMFDALSVWPTK